MTEKKDMWVINARRTVACKVVFEEEVDADEALELFHNGLYEDIIDEDILDEEGLDTAE